MSGFYRDEVKFVRVMVMDIVRISLECFITGGVGVGVAG